MAMRYGVCRGGYVWVSVYGWWGIIRPYTGPYTDMRHGWHVVSAASDLHMHAVYWMVCEHVWVCELVCWEVDMCGFVCMACGALQGFIRHCILI